MIKKRGSSRGQVTVFIIIGIVLLFSFAAIIYFVNLGTKDSLQIEETRAIAPPTFQPLQSFTENCLAQTGTRAFTLLGQQGGYIFPDLVGKYSSTNPTEADGIQIDPLSVPYWYYHKGPNEGQADFASLRPALEGENPLTIQAQVIRFVEQELPSCLQNFTAFQMDINTKEPQVRVQFTDKTVNLLLQMPLTATTASEEYEADRFIATLELPFKEYYEFASTLQEWEQNYSFLERQALELIATFSAVDAEKLPPTQSLRFDAAPTAIWTEIETKERMKGLLSSYVPVLRSTNDPTFHRFEYQNDVLNYGDLYQKNYDNMYLPLDGPNFEVDFDYFNWEPYLDVNDKGGVVQPSTVTAQGYIIPPISTQHYLTVYDLSYPVLITLQDQTSLKGQGYKFVFALEANVRGNGIFKPNAILPPPVTNPYASLACDHKNSDPIKAVVLDSATNTPVDAVTIGFSIPQQDDCDVGKTNARGELTSSYPAAYGGVVTFAKEGYLTNFYPIDTYETSNEILGYAVAGQQAVQLHPFKEVSVNLKKKQLEKCVDDTCPTQGVFKGPSVYHYQPDGQANHSWSFTNAAKDLEEGEEATLIFERVNKQAPDQQDEYSTVVQVKPNTSSTVRLVPGLYKLQILASSDKSITIPDEERCPTIFSCSTIPGTEVENALLGQLSWETPTAYVEITPDQLYGSEQITFNVLTANLADIPEENRIVEDLQMFGMTSNLSLRLREQLAPVFQ